MIAVTTVCFVLIGLAAVLASVRLVIGPTIADRVVAADLLLTFVVMSAGVAAARTGDGTYLRVMLVVAVVGFLGTTMAAKFIEERGT
ncbi:MAG: monovalent cation/H+ antiporter complex subunit F [Microthrixaceae bacterium]